MKVESGVYSQRRVIVSRYAISTPRLIPVLPSISLIGRDYMNFPLRGIGFSGKLTERQGFGKLSVPFGEVMFEGLRTDE